MKRDLEIELENYVDKSKHASNWNAKRLPCHQNIMSSNDLCSFGKSQNI